jgi:hypothetical protein
MWHLVKAVETVARRPQNHPVIVPVEQFAHSGPNHERNLWEYRSWLKLKQLHWIPVALAIIFSATVALYCFNLIRDRLSPALPQDINTPRKHDSPEQSLSGKGLSSLFTPQVHYWSPQIQDWAAQWQLDPNLVATVMQIESCGHPQIQSSAGAVGLFQVMPFHFGANENPELPHVNAERGLSYLAEALKQAEGDIGRALAGYNGGHGYINRPIHEWPAETKRYVHWGTGIYTDATSGRSASAILGQWLSAGGSDLCEQAFVALNDRD